MAKYTTEVRSICETLAGNKQSEGYLSVNEIIANSRNKIFNFDYPLFDTSYKPVLETKILKHYYGREIGAETFGRWQLWLDAKMNEIMPYYNKLYESETLQYNPLHDVDLTITMDRDGTNKSNFDGTIDTTKNNKRTDDLTRTDNLTQQNDYTRTDNLTKEDDYTRTDNLTKEDDYTRTDNLTRISQDTGSETENGADVLKNTRWDVFSDTPQGALTDVDENEYLTNARKIIDDGSGSTKNKTTTFGKKVTETNTGTVKNEGTTENTGTQKNEGTTTNTGTQRNAGNTINTGTVKNTGTQEIEADEKIKDKNKTDIITTDDYTKHIFGKNYGKSFSELILNYRNTLINIDMMIINELSDLFMGLW